MEASDESTDFPQNTRRSSLNPLPQNAPGHLAAIGHVVENSIPLSIFPIQPDKMCVVFCGLPGVGKSHIARRLARYLNFFHATNVKVFNVCEYRKKHCAEVQDAAWFDPMNLEAAEIRRKINCMAIQDVADFLTSSSEGVAILDSTNPTHDRRSTLVRMIHSTGAKVLFVEVLNEDEDFLNDKYRNIFSSHVHSEYSGSGLSPSEAEQDYRQRVANYRQYFESLGSGPHASEESRWSYLQCDHSRMRFVLQNVRGYLPLKIVHFITNLRTSSHSFYLTRHGQSEYNAAGRIGGDSSLSAEGLNYARALANYAQEQIMKDRDGKDVPSRLWTSTLKRTKETGQFIPQTRITCPDPQDPSLTMEWIQMRPRAWAHLDEIFAGQE